MKNGSKPSTIPVYVTVLKPQNVAWKLKEAKDVITISTNALNVFVKNDDVIDYQTKDCINLVSKTN
ncbi:hypothetical protein ACFSKN_05210 [Mariniflexile gromovii]